MLLFQRLGPPNTLHLLVRDVKKVSLLFLSLLLFIYIIFFEWAISRFYFFFNLIFGCMPCSMWGLVPWWGIEPVPSASGVWCLNPWISRQVPVCCSLVLYLLTSFNKTFSKAILKFPNVVSFYWRHKKSWILLSIKRVYFFPMSSSSRVVFIPHTIGLQ